MHKIPHDQELPTIVYKSPGFLDAGNGATYKYMGCGDLASLDLALADGWHLTLPAAITVVDKMDFAVDRLALDLADAKAELVAVDEKIALASIPLKKKA